MVQFHALVTIWHASAFWYQTKLPNYPFIGSVVRTLWRWLKLSTFGFSLFSSCHLLIVWFFFAMLPYVVDCWLKQK